jgi:hypothetical protein
MSLPADEQWALDGIEARLKTSAPRLASMFAIFGRLFPDEDRPWRERLEGRSLWPWAGPAWLRSACRIGPRSAKLRRSGGRAVARVRALALIPLALVAIVTAVFLGAKSSAARACAPVVLVRVPPKVIGSPRGCAVTAQRAQHGVGQASRLGS